MDFLLCGRKTVPLGGHQENVMNMFSFRAVFYIWRLFLWYIRENQHSADTVKILKIIRRIFWKSGKTEKNNSSVGYRISRLLERNITALFILSVFKVTVEI